MPPLLILSIARAHTGTLETTHNTTGINVIVLRQALKLKDKGIPSLIERYGNGLISLRLAHKIAGLSHEDQSKLMNLNAKTFRVVMGQLGFLKDCEGIKRDKRHVA